MTDCLYECLKEAHLDRYYPNFIQRGLHNCESLVSLSMPDYPRYGIVSMEDRLHLFKLIQIIKSIQGEGMVCQHTNHHNAKQSEQNNTKATIQGNRPKEVLVKKGVSMGGMLLNTNSASAPFHTSGQQQQQTREQPTNKITNLQGQPLFREKPLFHWNQKTKKSPEVIFRKGSDSPIFKCRKTLRFTDSECESSDDEAPQVKNAPSSTGTVQTTTAPHTSITDATEPRAFFIDVKPKSNSLTRESSVTCTAMHTSPLKQAPIILSKEPNVCHAYFPHENTPQEEKPVYVEKVHHGNGYDYGVPTTPRMRTKVNENDKVGKIQVCIRKRPLTAAEVKRKELDIVKANESTSVVVNEPKMAVDLTPFVQQHIFHFDQVFDSNCSNEDIYKTSVRSLVKCIFNRGTATCFAFGQTGAGKTYTLLGSKGVPGLYQLAGQDIFDTINEQKARNSTTKRMLLWISYFEIYCGQLFDLLNKRKKLHVRENGKQKVCITGLAETRVHDVQSLVEVIQYGNIARSTGSTGVNPHSSRSHAVLQMEIRDYKDSRVGRLSFIDLAGSERASDVTEFDRQTRIEGAEINQSLLALKECIRSIDQDNKHTPYRQSKLTHILRESFVGNSQTVMIANIAPSQSCCENTLNTLRYADRVKELKKDGRSLSRNTPRTSKSSQQQSNRTLRRTPPSLFHPSKIPFSSTPKAKISPKNSGEDLNEILQNADESPIQGHQIQRIRLQKKHRSRICHSDNASNEGSYGDHLKHSDVNNNNGDTAEKLNTEQRPKSGITVKKVASNSEIRMHNSSVIVKETLSDTDVSKCGSFGLLQKEEESLPKKRSQSHGSLCVCEQELPADRQPDKQHTSSTPDSSLSAQSDNELIEGHLAIINHLDKVLSKAKSVVNKMSPKSSSVSSPGEQASFGSSKSSHSKARATQDAVPFRRTLFRESHSSAEHSYGNDRQQESGSVCSQKSTHERASESRLYPWDAQFHGSQESSLERSDGSGMAQKWITQGESRHSSTNDHLEADKYTPSNMSDSGNATSERDGQKYENRPQPATGIKVDNTRKISLENASSTGTKKFEGRHLYYRGSIEPKTLFQPQEPKKSVQSNDLSGLKSLEADKSSWESDNDVVIEVHAKDLKLFTEEDECITQTLEPAALPGCVNNCVTERGEPIVPLSARDNCTTEKMEPDLPMSAREFPQHKAFMIEKHTDERVTGVLANSDIQRREASSITIKREVAMHTGGSSCDIPITREADDVRLEQNMSESEVTTNVESSGLSSGSKFQSVIRCEYKQESDMNYRISDAHAYAHQQTCENVKVDTQERGSSPEQSNSSEKRSWASVLSQSNESHSLQSSQDSGISTLAQTSVSSKNLVRHDQPRNECLTSRLPIHTDSAFTAVSSVSQDKSQSQSSESHRSYSSYNTTRSASFSQAEMAFMPIEPCSTTVVDKHKIAVPVVVTKTILTCHSDMDTRECTMTDPDHKSDVQAICYRATAQTAQPNQGQCNKSVELSGESNRNQNILSKPHPYSQMQQKTNTNLASDKVTTSIRNEQLHEFHNQCSSTGNDPNFIHSGQGQNGHSHRPDLSTQSTSSQAAQSIYNENIHTHSTNDDRFKHNTLSHNGGNEQQPARSVPENIQPATQHPAPQLQSPAVTTATDQSVITQAQNELIAQHEEQLSTLIALCKQEMRLLIDVKSGTSDFAKYLSITKSIQNTKTQSVNSLMSGIDQYLHLLAKLNA